MVGPDASGEEIIKQFVSEFSEFTGDNTLLEKKIEFLNWKSIFIFIKAFALKKGKNFTLILDEIQWIAKEGTGFLGKLKEAWIDWEESTLIKVIICGSSNKFFALNTGGAETVLRGLKTRSDIHVSPISLSECYKKRFFHWSQAETVFMYFLTGGIPYYLNQIDPSKPFITAINDAFFTSTSIYLSEIEEILSLDFNKQGSKKVKTILSAIGAYGCSEAQIIKKTKIPKSTVHVVLEKLLTYKLLEIVYSASSKTKGNDAGAKYLIADFYLASYFQLISPIAGRIEKNRNSILFKFSASNLYIENYTGPMFERLVKCIILEKNLKLKIFTKLDLRSNNFEVEHYWDREQQIDLIVNGLDDRISRAIEVKWSALSKTEYNETMKKLYEKNYHLKPYFSRRNYIVTQNMIPNVERKNDLIEILDLI
jgi:hypothetical protein